MDSENIEEIMKEMDEKHIVFFTRATQAWNHG